MPFPCRLTIIAILTAMALTVYGISKHYSSSLIAYVVEEALLQKLPAGADPALVRTQFHSLMSALPDRRARLEKLLSMSQYLEKLQKLTKQELEELLGKEVNTPRKAAFMEFSELSPRAIV